MKEEEIRPKAIFDEYLRLATKDAQAYFDAVKRQQIICPACETPGVPAFEKSGFVYEQCPNCQTLYVSPRPVALAFSRYYRESPSCHYWATTFYKETAQARKEKLWKPKARQIYEIMAKFCPTPNLSVVDIGGGYGLFAEEIRELTLQNPIVIEPSPHLASVCRNKDILVVEKFLEDLTPKDLPNTHKVFVSFELFEHLHDPGFFMSCLYSLMLPGDIFIFTTLSGLGLDIQVLWQESKSVTPPHHLNFFNPYSIKLLLKRTGFNTIQITTPGKLDIDILRNNEALVKDRFWKTLLAISSENEKQSWQNWIAEQGYSSHMWVICRKP
ncbi:hypothetical protein CEP10_07005 [Cylindrospermopsis raciborskii S07]|uniref:class I SAM-dependent methyltransferase n=2 Tax=Cylindrospermopsis raciborskii TaxID=77022 RepID=UPI000C9DD947|nr:methyltransferase domain-containing protein [Cylindrospermopsis raciborskii]PNK08661.1 hypothetical protein CEP10_07005 [Cylindrospermopsis raciborskii S07]PNK10263.1 hypothetical protein CEP12_04530 [Cylindrospermopsis raciborskii S14]PNK15140.1 hypothetical protein CEP09_10780 [Cylindrospermopsis raciborskii S06]PNK17423.1 hypothetical protein CEP08_10395 [Cylindrospermopsis raciborskii S05]